MFAPACKKVRSSVYGLMSASPLASTQAVASVGTAFMIARGVLVTAAHLLHVDGDLTRPPHTLVQAICAPDIGSKMEPVAMIAEDVQRDIALLRLDHPRSAACVELETAKVAVGTPCGSLGFPLAGIRGSTAGAALTLAERFQGASISAFHEHPNHSGQLLDYYETDSAMYRGSAGCPGFLVGGDVFAIYIATVSVGDAAQGGSYAVNGIGPFDREAISIWVAAREIRMFANASGVDLS